MIVVPHMPNVFEIAFCSASCYRTAEIVVERLVRISKKFQMLLCGCGKTEASPTPHVSLASEPSKNVLIF